MLNNLDTTNTWISRTYYILENKTSGMKYLGQTTQNINTYLGSGSYWKKHCKKYGGYTRNNIDIIFYDNFSTEQEAINFLTTFTSYHGEYWLSKTWANQVPESSCDNVFYGSFVNNKKIKDGTHPFLKKNKHSNWGTSTRFGTDRFKAAVLEKYNVDNIMKVKEVSTKVAAKSGETKKRLGLYVGVKNPKSRSITINGVYFNLIKDACDYFKISLPTLKKYTDGKQDNIILNLERIQNNKKRVTNALLARGYK